MPTNLTAEAAAAYQRYLEARTVEDKIKALEEFIALAPKHKGTEKLLKQVKKTLTKLKLSVEKRKALSKRTTGTHPAFIIQKEGDAQISLIGVPASGKTTLFNVLTGSKIQIEKKSIFPSVGIFRFSGIYFQLIDFPSIASPNPSSILHGKKIMGLIRNSDLVSIIIDLTQDIQWQLDTLIGALRNSKIIVDRPLPPIKFEKRRKGGLKILGADYIGYSEEDIADILRSLNVSNGLLEIYGPATIEDLTLALDDSTVFKPAIIVFTKSDLVESVILPEDLCTKIPCISFSAKKPESIKTFGNLLKNKLGLIRVWTRKKDIIKERALVLKEGATVRDAAEKIHTDFVKKFRYAIIERKNSKIPKMRVGLNFKLEDDDILSIFIKE